MWTCGSPLQRTTFPLINIYRWQRRNSSLSQEPSFILPRCCVGCLPLEVSKFWRPRTTHSHLTPVKRTERAVRFCMSAGWEIYRGLNTTGEVRGMKFHPYLIGRRVRNADKKCDQHKFAAICHCRGGRSVYIFIPPDFITGCIRAPCPGLQLYTWKFRLPLRS